VTENFKNDSVISAVGPTSIGQGNPNILSIHYDSVANNYTLTASGNSQLFTPSNLLPQPSFPADNPYINNANTMIDNLAYFFDRTNPSIISQRSYKGFSVYSFVTTSGVDQLILSSNTIPIVSSDGSYTSDIVLSYVGFGSWFDGTVSGSNVNGTIDYFTYGAYTADSAMPRAGKGTYAFTLEGLIATTKVGFLSSTGQATADFGAGTITFATKSNLEDYPDGTGFSGTASGLTLPPGATGPFSATATIASGANQFTGNFSYVGSIAVTGTLNGRFYGPNAQEIGATFSGQSPSGAIVGAIVGSLGSGTIK
jgi:hypothetical protein